MRTTIAVEIARTVERAAITYLVSATRATITSMLTSRLQMLADAVRRGSSDALPAFWAELHREGSPIVEPISRQEAAVTFVWRDDERTGSVAVIQDWGTDGIREHQMLRLPRTDVWYLTRTMRMDTRTTYQLSPSSSADPNARAPYRPDPLNPKTHVASLPDDGHKIVFSLLELPDAPPLPWRIPTAIEGTVAPSRSDDGRRMWTYLPRAATTTSSLIVLAGRVYKDLLDLPRILDHLIERQRIRPIAALMIDSPDHNELLCDASFADHVATEIVPRFRNVNCLSALAQDSVVVGSSYGGLAAAFAALRHPDVFGTALCQTGWFRWHPPVDPEHHWLARQIPGASSSVRFWLQVGDLETARMLDGGPSQLEANRHFRDALRENGSSVSYEEYSGGHDTSSLEAPLARALTGIFGSDDGTAGAPLSQRSGVP